MPAPLIFTVPRYPFAGLPQRSSALMLMRNSSSASAFDGAMTTSRMASPPMTGSSGKVLIGMKSPDPLVSTSIQK